MTTVYGVTRYGATQQISGQLEDINDFPQEHVFDASRYLTAKTFHCLQQMFTATKEIQVGTKAGGRGGGTTHMLLSTVYDVGLNVECYQSSSSISSGCRIGCACVQS